MASEKSSNIGCGGILVIGIFLVFLFLKLGQFGEVATWSWLWVTSPLWIYAGVTLTLVIIVVISFLVVSLFTD